MFRTFVFLSFLAATLHAQPVLTPHACSEANTLRSTTGASPATRIQFLNDSSGVIKVYWIDTTSQRSLYSTVSPRAVYTQGTFSGHVWLVTDGKDACLALF